MLYRPVRMTTIVLVLDDNNQEIQRLFRILFTTFGIELIVGGSCMLLFITKARSPSFRLGLCLLAHPSSAPFTCTIQGGRGKLYKNFKN